MIIELTYKGKRYNADLDQGINISSVLSNTNDLKAFGAPDVVIEPVVAGDFVGDIKEGSPVNFKNVFLNPHGNGTHTECLAHVSDMDWPVYKALNKSHFVADLITLNADQFPDGAMSIGAEIADNNQAEALIIRVNYDKPNDFSGTNPPYFTANTMNRIVEAGYQHLVVELPSVDKEDDGGKVENHKIFFELLFGEGNLNKTITEMVQIPNSLEDGTYLLNIQVINLELDASPSRLILYPLTDS